MPIPHDSVHVDLDDGTAIYQVRDLATVDFHDFVNDAKFHGSNTPTTLSFKMYTARGPYGPNSSYRLFNNSHLDVNHPVVFR